MSIVVTACLDEAASLTKEGMRLLDTYKESASSFVPSFLSWVDGVQAMLERYKRSELTMVTAIKAKALAARSGLLAADGVALGKAAPRKRIAGACALLLSQVLEALYGAQVALEARKDEAAKPIQQILMLLMRDGRLEAAMRSSPTPGAMLSSIWDYCRSAPDVSAGAPQVLSLVSLPDALRLIDETLSQWSLADG